ncbi:MAG: ACP S-malonyltransferase [Myxococcota bacterium]|nr:ACP S-malonyltransferase [Myxococcota bacterium]
MSTAYLFPGQGSQSVGMGADWLGRSELVRQTFEEADEALGSALSKIILEGPMEDLTRTENTQPALLTVSVAYWRVLEAEGLQPDVVAGHSLGEYSALVCAGALGFGDAVRLTRLRGQAMQTAVPLGVGTMAALLRIDTEDKVLALCAAATEGDEVLQPAGYNTVGQAVVAGHISAVRRAVGLAGEHGGIGKELNVSAPFHCSMLIPAGERLSEALEEVEIAPLTVPYVPNVTGQWTENPSPETVRSNLVEQVSKPVMWLPGMRSMAEHGVSRWLEVGSGRTLVGLLKRFDRSAESSTFEAEGWKS